jgi:PKD repeat protein
MKKLFLTFLGLAIMQLLYAQSYNPDFLDGRIMFKIKGEAAANMHQGQQTDPNSFSLLEQLNDYPELKAALEGYQITKFERPSYFTNKKELMKIYRLHFSNFSKIDEIVGKLTKLNIIEFAEKEPIYKTGFVPNDPQHTGTNKWYHTLVGSENAWNISLGRNAVKVAIVDNAVFAGHSDLTTFRQYDVADNDNDATPPLSYTQNQGWSHGTHCAGLSTADINNSIGIASLGGNVELIGVKATPNSATGSSIYYGYDGVQWACQNGAHVVSMSYGGPSAQAAMQILIDAYPNVVFLAAAGNDGNSTVQYPAGYNNVIGVGSVDQNDSRSSFSNFNGGTTFVDIASPGGFSNGGLLSTVYTTGANSYAKMGGTSMATPFAAGLVGLMLSVNPNLTPTQILNCLTSTGASINQNIGPRINALAAVQCVQATTTAGAAIASFFAIPTDIIEGTSTTFYDNSPNGGAAISTWQWSFPNGTPNSFTGQTPPAITYATAGSYDVTLSVTNANGTANYTRTGYIKVSLEPYGEWIRQNSGFTTATRGINYISIVDANTVWATAYDGSGGTANIQQFTKTTNGGATWTPGTINIGNTGLGISMIHAISSTTAWLAAYPTAGGQTGGIWKTTNGGTTWTRQATATFNNAASFTNVVHFWDANEGFCQGDPINGDFELYRTVNGGTTWTLVPGTSIPNPLNANEFGYTRQIEVVGNSVWFTTSVGRIYHSTDKGVTWSVYTSPISDFGGAITTGMSANLSFSSATEGLIVDINGLVYKTVNSGATWTAVTTTGPVLTNGLCFIEGTNTVFTTGTGSSFSQDGGVNWNIIDTEQHLYVEFINPSVGWSGWFNQSSTVDGMWKWNDLSSPLSPAISSNTRNICAAGTVNFSDATTGGTITSWQWSFPGGTPASSTSATPTVTYPTAGIYPVSLTVSDGTFQSTYNDTAYVTVENFPAVPSAISGNSAPCAFSTESYSVTSVSNVAYNWAMHNSWSGTSGSNVIFVSLSDTAGTLSVTAGNSCGNSAPSSMMLNIGALPVANFTYVDNGGNVTFTNTSNNAISWSWDFGDANTSTTQDPSNSYTANGNYTVTLISSNACGDSDTTTQVLNVVIVGTEQILDEFSLVRVYPNPAADVLVIDGLPQAVVGTENIRIIDMLGRTVLTSSITNTVQSLPISELAAGMYSLTVKGKTYKFVKQ